MVFRKGIAGSQRLTGGGVHHHIEAHLTRTGKSNVTESIYLSSAKTFANVSTVSKSNSFGNSYKNSGMLLKSLISFTGNS